MMNFNLKIGDYWFFDSEHEMGLIVKDKYEVTYSGQKYPILIVNYISQYQSSKHRLKADNVIVSPLNANPFLIGGDFKELWFPDWSVFRCEKFPDKPAEEWLPEDLHLKEIRFDGYLSIIWKSHSFENAFDKYEGMGEYKVVP